MTLDEIEAELSRWTFMPGYRFVLRRNTPAVIDGIRLFDHDAGILEIHSRVPDSHNPDRQIDVVATYPMPMNLFMHGPEQFTRWLRHAVQHRMSHEADEWLKRDGEMVFDPHANGR